MNNIYIVCENKATDYIPKPQGPSITNWNEMPFEPQINGEFSIEPRFDPITPQFYPRLLIFPQERPNNIVYVCKDLDTAKSYVSGYSNRYILGPYKVV